MICHQYGFKSEKRHNENGIFGRFTQQRWQDWFKEAEGKYQGGSVEGPDPIIDLEDLKQAFLRWETHAFLTA